MVNDKLAVAEAFCSIQGEGHTAGAHAYFLRLAGCNLMCGGYGTQKTGELYNGATWRCDSIEVWMRGQSQSFIQVIKFLGGEKAIDDLRFGSHLIITGGEPLMQQDALVEFFKWFYNKYGFKPICEIETNGTVLPSVSLKNYIKYWNISPKLANSGMSFAARLKRDVLVNLSTSTLIKPMFKFVIQTEKDWEEVREDFLIHIDKRQVWLMPGADNREDLIALSEQVASIAVREGLRYSSRTHLVIWDKKTGV